MCNSVSYKITTVWLLRQVINEVEQVSLLMMETIKALTGLVWCMLY